MRLKRGALFFVIVPIIVIVCGVLWLWAGYPVVHIPSEHGTRDLRGVNFDDGAFDLYGPVEYIPNALLTPEEFVARHDEIQIGKPEEAASYSTSRMRILVPEGTYGLMLWNADQASNIYINGNFMESVGMPGSSLVDSIGEYKLLFYTSEAKGGVVEIVQQASRAALSEGFSHSDFIFGRPEIIRGIYNRHYVLQSILLGCFLALALVHLALYLFRREYRANLWAMLFCVTWFIRTGVTINSWILTTFLPIPLITMLRLDWLTIPAGILLLCLALNTLFPSVLQTWFLKSTTFVCAAFIGVFLLAGADFMLGAMSLYYYLVPPTLIYIVVRLCMKLRKPSVGQIVILIGIGIIISGGMRDLVVFAVPFLFSVEQAASRFTQPLSTEFALFVFVLLQTVVMFRGTIQEVMAAKEAEQKLAMENAALDRMNRLKNEMMQNLTHELRTPLAVMSTYAQLIIQGIQEDSPGQQTVDDLQVIREEAERLAEMATGFLDVFREQEKMRGRKAVSIGVLLRQAGRLCVPMLASKNNRIVMDVPEDLPRVSGNADELTQVMHNLITNASNHTQGGQITIGAGITETGRTVEIWVCDTGAGIAPDLLPRVFMRRISDGGGAGLGLSICREIIEAHGGVIWIESEHGKGTKVRFTLSIMEGGESDGRETDDTGGGER